MKRLMLLLLAFMLPATAASAKTAREYAYPVKSVFATAVRYLIVDKQYKVLERDETSGFILFEYLSDKKLFKGSVELIDINDGDGRKATRAIFTLPDRPSYMEIMLADGLGKKLYDELGAPAPAPPPPPDPPKDPPKDEKPAPPPLNSPPPTVRP